MPATRYLEAKSLRAPLLEAHVRAVLRRGRRVVRAGSGRADADRGRDRFRGPRPGRGASSHARPGSRASPITSARRPCRFRAGFPPTGCPRRSSFMARPSARPGCWPSPMLTRVSPTITPGRPVVLRGDDGFRLSVTVHGHRLGLCPGNRRPTVSTSAPMATLTTMCRSAARAGRSIRCSAWTSSTPPSRVRGARPGSGATPDGQPAPAGRLRGKRAATSPRAIRGGRLGAGANIVRREPGLPAAECPATDRMETARVPGRSLRPRPRGSSRRLSHRS